MDMYNSQMHANTRILGIIMKETSDLMTAVEAQVSRRVTMFSNTYDDFILNDKRAYKKKQSVFLLNSKDLKCNPYYIVMLQATGFPKEEILNIFNERAEMIKSKMNSLALKCNSLDDLRFIVERCCDYAKEMIEQFEDYLHGVEDTLTNVIAEDWKNKLTDVSQLKMDEQSCNFNLLVRFTDKFSKSYLDESLNKKSNFSSCMLIDQDTSHSYQNRKLGFIIQMEAENLVIMNTGDAHSALISCDRVKYDMINYSDVIENYYLTYTPIDSYIQRV